MTCDAWQVVVVPFLFSDRGTTKTSAGARPEWKALQSEWSFHSRDGHFAARITPGPATRPSESAARRTEGGEPRAVEDLHGRQPVHRKANRCATPPNQAAVSVQVLELIPVLAGEN